MGKVYDIDDRLADFIQRQHVFFVGTAPTSVEEHLNVSPKGQGEEGVRAYRVEVNARSIDGLPGLTKSCC